MTQVASFERALRYPWTLSLGADDKKDTSAIGKTFETLLCFCESCCYIEKAPCVLFDSEIWYQECSNTTKDRRPGYKTF